MSTLPLEVHEVLEEEYETRYGARPPSPPAGALYASEQIIDQSWARSILGACGFDVAN